MTDRGSTVTPTGGVGQKFEILPAKTGSQHGKSRREIERNVFLRGQAARRGSLADLAALPGMPSVPILRKLATSRPDFPLIERGVEGRPCRVNLRTAADFVRQVWPGPRTRPSDRGDGVVIPDRAGTLRDLAAQPGMPSELLLRRLMRRHAAFPVLDAGASFRPYLIDLEDAAAFVAAVWSDARRHNRSPRRGGAQSVLRLDGFAGGSGSKIDFL